MKFLPTLLAFFLLAAAPTPKVITNTLKSTVTIITVNKDHRMGCTGFVVDIQTVITAKHCIPIVDGDEVFVDGKLSRVVKSNDELALLRIEPSKPPLDIRKEKANIGEYVWALGYAYGELAVYERNIAGVYEGWVLTNGKFTDGMSGGPVVDEDGNVVGLIQASDTERGYISSAKDIREFTGIK